MVRPDLLQGWQPQPEGPGEEPSDCAVIGGAVEELELDPPRAIGIVVAAASCGGRPRDERGDVRGVPIGPHRKSILNRS